MNQTRPQMKLTLKQTLLQEMKATNPTERKVRNGNGKRSGASHAAFSEIL